MSPSPKTKGGRRFARRLAERQARREADRASVRRLLEGTSELAGLAGEMLEVLDRWSLPLGQPSEGYDQRRRTIKDFEERLLVLAGVVEADPEDVPPTDSTEVIE